MIDVRMREQDEIDGFGIKVKCGAIFFVRFASALKHAAIDKKA
jgi:hypothetical protein